MSQVAETEPGAAGIAGSGHIGLLTPVNLPVDGTAGPQATLDTIKPLGFFGAEGPAAPPGAMAGPTGPGAPRRPGGRTAPAARPGTAAIATSDRSPCGTGWPDRPPRETAWPRGSQLDAGARRRGPERRSSQCENSCALAGQLGSVPLARDFARATLRGWGLVELCDDVTSVVSELVTNALRYGLAGLGAPGPDTAGARSAAPGAGAGRRWPAASIELRLMLRPADVICMVADPGAGVPALAEPGHLAEGGRGLHVVQSCSDRWGWDPLTDGGKVVWAAFRL